MLNKSSAAYLAKNGIGGFENKCVLIVGATGAIGGKIAEIMLHLGARVLMTCRNPEKAKTLKARLLTEYSGAQIDILPLDLTDMDSIRNFVQDVSAQQMDIYDVILCAGAFHRPGEQTRYGADLVFGVNFLSNACLMRGLMPYLRQLPHPVTILAATSLVYRFVRRMPDDFLHPSGGNFAVYAKSKYCLTRWMSYTAQQEKNVRLCLFHPGVCMTDMALNGFAPIVGFLGRKLHFLFNSTEKSALCAACALFDPEKPMLFSPRGLLHVWGYPGKEQISPVPKSVSEALARKTDETLNEITDF